MYNKLYEATPTFQRKEDSMPTDELQKNRSRRMYLERMLENMRARPIALDADLDTVRDTMAPNDKLIALTVNNDEQEKAEIVELESPLHITVEELREKAKPRYVPLHGLQRWFAWLLKPRRLKIYPALRVRLYMIKEEGMKFLEEP
jgi:hypothetical protein